MGGEGSGAREKRRQTEKPSKAKVVESGVKWKTKWKDNITFMLGLTYLSSMDGEEGGWIGGGRKIEGGWWGSALLSIMREGGYLLWM